MRRPSLLVVGLTLSLWGLAHLEPIQAQAGILTGLMAYYSLDEASGNAIDAHSTHDLTDTNTVGTAAGKVGDARDFELDTTEYFTIADNADLSLTTGMTVACWFNLESLGTNQFLVSKYKDDTNDREYFLRYETGGASGSLEMAVSSNGAALTAMYESTVINATATWYFVAMGYDGANIWIRLNGQARETTAYSSGIFDGPSDFMLGNKHAGGSHLDGLLDECAVWDRNVTDADLDWIYNSGTGRSYTDLVDNNGGTVPRMLLLGVG